jgi:hypothetical protein
MRGLLTIILLFFITGSCFALKPVPPRPASHSVCAKKITPVSRCFQKIHPEEDSSFSQDEFEHHTLIRQLLKKPAVSSVQLFYRSDNGIKQPQAIRLYTANTQTNYNFIFHFLYPKHVFW